MWPGFDSRLGVICGLSLLLVLVLARRVFLWYSGYPPLSKFQFDLETVERTATPWIPLKFPFFFFLIFVIKLELKKILRHLCEVFFLIQNSFSKKQNAKSRHTQTDFCIKQCFFNFFFTCNATVQYLHYYIP